MENDDGVAREFTRLFFLAVTLDGVDMRSPNSSRASRLSGRLSVTDTQTLNFSDLIKYDLIILQYIKNVNKNISEGY